MHPGPASGKASPHAADPCDLPALSPADGDAWESPQPCTLTEGSGSVRLDPPSSRKPPDHLGTAGRCGTEFLDGFSGLGSGSRRPSRKDQFVDSASRGTVERV